MEGAEEPFDPAFGLRRSGRDPANAEFLQGAAHLRGLGPIRELFRHTHRRPGIAVEDAMAIGIGGAGKAIAADELAEEEKIALGILLPAEDGRQDASGRIVNGGEENQAGAASTAPAASMSKDQTVPVSVFKWFGPPRANRIRPADERV